jgi:hypothetical protein
VSYECCCSEAIPPGVFVFVLVPRIGNGRFLESEIAGGVSKSFIANIARRGLHSGFELEAVALAKLSSPTLRTEGWGHLCVDLLPPCGFCLFPDRRPGRFFGSCLLEQGQGIRSVERVFADGPLTRGAQGDVYTTVAGQEDRLHVVEHPLALLWSQLGVLLNRIPHLAFG